MENRDIGPEAGFTGFQNLARGVYTEGLPGQLYIGYMYNIQCLINLIQYATSRGLRRTVAGAISLRATTAHTRVPGSRVEHGSITALDTHADLVNTKEGRR